jgi:NADH dehydrogenase/NADH:ubiquinone oxidoreductase subunit G
MLSANKKYQSFAKGRQGGERTIERNMWIVLQRLHPEKKLRRVRADQWTSVWGFLYDCTVLHGKAL